MGPGTRALVKVQSVEVTSGMRPVLSDIYRNIRSFEAREGHSWSFFARFCGLFAKFGALFASCCAQRVYAGIEKREALDPFCDLWGIVRHGHAEATAVHKSPFGA